jgi:AraC family transcriptional regulator
MSEFAFEERAAKPILAIRLVTPVEGIPAALAVALPEVWHAAEELGLAPDGPPYTRYFTMPAPEIEYEAGVPLAAPAPTAVGRATPGELPGGTVAVAWHVGPYDRLGDTYRALEAWIAEQGRAVGGPMWEVYWTDPDSAPPEEWRTEIVVPVR